MARQHNRTALVRFLKLVMGISLAGMGVMLLAALLTWRLRGGLAQVLLTFVGLFFGSLLMQVQLRARRRAGRSRRCTSTRTR